MNRTNYLSDNLFFDRFPYHSDEDLWKIVYKKNPDFIQIAYGEYPWDPPYEHLHIFKRKNQWEFLGISYYTSWGDSYYSSPHVVFYIKLKGTKMTLKDWKFLMKFFGKKLFAVKCYGDDDFYIPPSKLKKMLFPSTCSEFNSEREPEKQKILKEFFTNSKNYVLLASNDFHWKNEERKLYKKRGTFEFIGIKISYSKNEKKVVFYKKINKLTYENWYKLKKFFSKFLQEDKRHIPFWEIPESYGRKTARELTLRDFVYMP